MQTYIVELKGYDTTNLLEKTLYWSSASFKAFASSDSDRPNQYYQPRLTDIGVISRRMFASGRTFGASNVNGGVITVSNADFPAWPSPIPSHIGAGGHHYRGSVRAS